MRRPLVSAALLLCLGLAAEARAAAAAAAPALVVGDGTAEAEPRLVIPQWERLLPRLAEEAPAYDACARRPDRCPTPGARAWLALLARLAAVPRAEQVRAVNAFANRWPYRPDEGTWGRTDHWVTPLEFLDRSGDCEDYAIIKYVSLRRLGVPPEDLRLLVVQDTARDVAHAVLASRVGGDGWQVLDNLSERVLPLRSVAHYQPYYALNESARWIFPSPARPAAAAAAARSLRGVAPAPATAGPGD